MMLRREVIEEVGGFDTRLRTAEDIELHLRAARRFGVGVVPEVLARIRLGLEEGLSHGQGTYHDYMDVICRYVDEGGDAIDARTRHQILLHHYVVSARGLVLCGWYREGIAFALQGARHVRSLGETGAVLRLGYVLGCNAAARTLRSLAGRGPRGAA
jgi:hypothetical protein